VELDRAAPSEGFVRSGHVELVEQLLHVAVGQAGAQLPAHRDRDHLPWEPVADRRGQAEPRANTASLFRARGRIS
jgi:hypothetical protein